jgi:hypothetical protein
MGAAVTSRTRDTQDIAILDGLPICVERLLGFFNLTV